MWVGDGVGGVSERVSAFTCPAMSSPAAPFLNASLLTTVSACLPGLRPAFGTCTVSLTSLCPFLLPPRWCLQLSDIMDDLNRHDVAGSEAEDLRTELATAQRYRNLLLVNAAAVDRCAAVRVVSDASGLCLTLFAQASSLSS